MSSTSGPTAAITTDIFAGFMISNNNLDLVVLKYKYIYPIYYYDLKVLIQVFSIYYYYDQKSAILADYYKHFCFFFLCCKIINKNIGTGNKIINP